MSDIDALRCSDAQVEPLPGSAKQESVYVLYEHPFGWSRDILDGGTFGEELTAQLKAFLKKRAGLQLIRYPGRDGRKIDRPRLFLVFTESAVTETMVVDGPEDILDLDLSGPGRNGAQRVDHPLVLVCTHGKRDVCCAVKGRPVAKHLVDTYLNESNELMVWETSHTKGHRFAPSLMLMPWGYSFGRLNEEAASSMVNYAMAGRYFLPGNRGRGLFSPRGQVAELAVAAQLVDAGERLEYGQLRADDGRVTHLDGRSWTVSMDKRKVDGVVSSCGDEPKTGSVWEAVKITAESE